MCKFAFLPFFAILICSQAVQAQVRDLFAEFEEEAAASESASVENAASPETVQSATPVEKAAIPVENAATLESSAVVETPVVPAAVDSLAQTSASSSSVADSVSSAEVLSSSSVTEVSSSDVLSSSSILISSSAAVQADSIAALDSVAANDSLILSSSSSIPSSSSFESSSSADAPVVALSSSSMSRRDLLGPVKVSKVYGMDEVKGRYKSPRKALFMSLVIPGSGQLYTGGSKFTYARGAVYLALEAALWGGWYYYSVYKYDKQVNRYKKFAKAHYSIGRYETGMRELYHKLADETEESRFETRYMGSRETFCEALYGKASSYGCYTAGKLFEDENHKNKFSGNHPLGEEIKSLGNIYDRNSLFQEIAGTSYVLGWDDTEDMAAVGSLGLESDSSSVVALGTSKNMKRYRDMRGKANDYADMQAWFFGGIILNHLVSALDAAFTANAHNKELYSEELSWYDRLHFDSYVNVFDGFDVGVQASWGF